MNVVFMISVLVLGVTEQTLAQGMMGGFITVLESIISNPRFSKITQLLHSDPQLYTALNTTTQMFTAFLPTNDIIGNMPMQLDELKNHFINERLDLNTVNVLTPKLSLSNHYLWLHKISDGQVTVDFHINGASVVANPFLASNGLMYEIDSLLNNLGSDKPLPIAIRDRGAQFTKFTDLLGRAQLSQLNATTSVYTMFVVQNNAIYDSIMNCASDQYITDLLSRHVVGEAVLFKPTLLHNVSIPALNGAIVSVYNPSSMTFTLQSDTANAEVVPARVTQFDYPTANGVMHILDRFLHSGPNIMDHLESSSMSVQISTFTYKLNQFAPLASSMCDRDAPHQYTLFAFTNTAFNALTEDQQNLTRDELKLLMERHILETPMLLSNLSTDWQPYVTLSADNVEILQENGEFFVEYANVKAKLGAEVVTDNGVVYTIDQVLVGAAPSLNAATSLAFSFVCLLFIYFF